MTEQEWLTAAEPGPMLAFLRKTRQVSDRKLRLLTAACWYRYEGLKKDAGGWVATELAEREAERLKGFSVRELKQTQKEVEFAAGAIAGASIKARKAERGLQACLLRCIVGNPFRPVTVDPRWLTPSVVGIARSIYKDRAFERLPVLSDALEDAGCTDEVILTHLRSEGPHVRGCFPIDLVLGRA